jgi:hypothetical protein
VWWANTFKAVDGVAPNYEALARQDPEYLAADEFTRAEVMARIIDRPINRVPVSGHLLDTLLHGTYCRMACGRRGT